MKIAVAGHICLDIIPRFATPLRSVAGAIAPASLGSASGEKKSADSTPSVPNSGTTLIPGTLTEVAGVLLATGGAVSNTGIALHRLGLDISLIAKVGDDDFGLTIQNIMGRQADALADGIIVSEGEETSHTIVINPPGTDRLFLHCPGANHTFCADDIPMEKLKGVELFHFGYPTLMRRMFQNNGSEMKTLFERVHEAGSLTSLDMTCVDPNSEAGQVDWFQWLENVLPSVDLFLPSIDEILFMVNRPKYEDLSQKFPGDMLRGIDRTLVEETAQMLIDLGVSVVVIKLGNQGLYLRTSQTVPGRDATWSNVSLFMPCLETDVVGTTGAGDCTIAGFLAGFASGANPADAATFAVGTGAFSTESADATGAIPSRETVQKRIASGWAHLESKFEN